MQASEIAEGKNYITSAGQVRFVHKIEDGKVIYSSRGGAFTKDWEKTAPRPPQAPSVDAFAAAVEREVDYIFDPRFA